MVNRKVMEELIAFIRSNKGEDLVTFNSTNYIALKRAQ